MNKIIFFLLLLIVWGISACNESSTTNSSPPSDNESKNSEPQDSSSATTLQLENEIPPPRTHLFRSGETLWNLCRTYYGNRHYSSVVALYNDIEDVNRIDDSTLIKVPALDTLLKDEKLGLVKTIPEEIDLLLETRELFMKHEKQLFEIRGEKEKGTRIELSETTINDLKKVENNIQTSIDQMKAMDDSIRPPQKVINQLRQVANNVNQLSQGQHDGPYGYDLDMFHQNLINALKYLILWQRD